MPRKSRPSTLPSHSFLVPINVKDFGDIEKDPCFGKLFNLMADECQVCGDNELCSIAFSLKVKDRMISKESHNHNLDLIITDLELVKDVKEYLDKCRDRGIRKPLALSKAMKKFKITKEFINTKT